MSGQKEEGKQTPNLDMAPEGWGRGRKKAGKLSGWAAMSQVKRHWGFKHRESMSPMWVGCDIHGKACDSTKLRDPGVKL